MPKTLFVLDDLFLFQLAVLAGLMAEAHEEGSAGRIAEPHGEAAPRVEAAAGAAGEGRAGSRGKAAPRAAAGDASAAEVGFIAAAHGDDLARAAESSCFAAAPLGPAPPLRSARPRSRSSTGRDGLPPDDPLDTSGSSLL